MSLLRNIASGLRSLFRKERVSHDLDDELNGFLEMAAEEKMKQGMSRRDAFRAVRLERVLRCLRIFCRDMLGGHPFWTSHAA